MIPSYIGFLAHGLPFLFEGITCEEDIHTIWEQTLPQPQDPKQFAETGEW